MVSYDSRAVEDLPSTHLPFYHHYFKEQWQFISMRTEHAAASQGLCE